jgi:hypothetical protein
VYRYTEQTREDLLEIFDKLRDRIWIPHQAAYEYQKDRFGVIWTQTAAYDKLERLIDDLFENGALKKLDTELNSYKRHPLINREEILKPIRLGVEAAKNSLRKSGGDHPDLMSHDELQERLTNLFDGRVGEAYGKEQLATIYKQSSERFSERVPPGYKDEKDKQDEREKYGDVVLWFQMMDHASGTKAPIIFVTDDSKEDWWWMHGGRTIGPRPELIEEMYSKSGTQFYMYHADDFIKHAGSFLKLREREEAIAEAKRVRREANRPDVTESQGDLNFRVPGNDFSVRVPGLAAAGLDAGLLRGALEDAGWRRQFRDIQNLGVQERFSGLQGGALADLARAAYGVSGRIPGEREPEDVGNDDEPDARDDDDGPDESSG